LLYGSLGVQTRQAGVTYVKMLGKPKDDHTFLVEVTFKIPLLAREIIQFNQNFAAHALS